MENIQHALAPVLAQIAISYIATGRLQNHAQLAFFAILVCFIFPLTIFAIISRAIDHQSAMFLETWAITALLAQTVFYYGYEMRALSHQHAFLALVVFMNEVTMYGGNWFGHRVMTWMCFFFSIKMIISAIDGNNTSKLWSAIVCSEFVIMSAVPLVAIWTNGAIGWFVPAFLIAVPIAFPTKNMYIPPSHRQQGLLYVADISMPLKIMLTENGD